MIRADKKERGMGAAAAGGRALRFIFGAWRIFRAILVGLWRAGRKMAGAFYRGTPALTAGAAQAPSKMWRSLIYSFCFTLLPASWSILGWDSAYTDFQEGHTGWALFVLLISFVSTALCAILPGCIAVFSGFNHLWRDEHWERRNDDAASTRTEWDLFGAFTGVLLSFLCGIALKEYNVWHLAYMYFFAPADAR